MKGLSIKKLAAIAVGGALVGSALAPLAAAIDISKSDVIGATGSPVVNVVAGDMAAASDFVWAGNIAARVAQLATVETSLTGGEGSATPTDLTVDLAIGGSTSYSTEYAKTYDGSNYPLSNAANSPEFIKAASSGQLPFLTNTTKSYRYNSSSYNITVKETIGITADAGFISQKPIKDLVVYMDNTGDFNYVLDLGDGIPCRAGSDTAANSALKFTDTDDDHILIPFMGEEFTVQECDMISATKQIKLIKESAKATYNEGDTIPGLVGKGAYAGQEMSVKLAAVTQASGTDPYQARFDLYDAEGNLVDSQTRSPGIYLNNNFLDAEGAYALETVVYVSSINVEPTSSRGVMTMVVGKNVVTLANGKQYPYDSTNTDTSTYLWTSDIDQNTSTTTVNVPTVTAITIKNQFEVWNSEQPLWSANSSLTEAGVEAAAAGGDIAHFLQGEESSLGYDFVKIKFDGFKEDQDTTNIIYGNNKIVYRDSENTKREIPFWIKLQSKPQSGVATEGLVFTDIGGIDFYSKCYKPASDGVVTLNIYDNNYLNGAQLNIYAETAGKRTVYITTDIGDVNIFDANNTSIDVDLNGVQFTVTEAIVPQAGGTAYWGATLEADGNCSYAGEAWSSTGTNNAHLMPSDPMTGTASSSVTTIELTGDETNSIYFDDDNTTRTPGRMPINFVRSSYAPDTYRYVQYYSAAATGQTGDGYLYLLLHESTNFSNTFTSADANFCGTDHQELGDYGPTEPVLSTGSKGGATEKYYPWYLPDEEAFNLDPTDNDFVIGIFGAKTNNTNWNNFRVHIDTTTDNLIALPNSELSNYVADVNYVGNFDSATEPRWVLKSRTDTDSALHAGVIDYGTTATLTDDMQTVTFVVPESQLYLSLSLLGEGATQTVTGGETAEGVVSGETVNIGGKNITVESIGYTAGTCTVEGATYPQIVPVNQLVYTDSPAPAGNHIIVGGYLVNKLAEGVVLGDGSTLQEALTAPGEKVAEVLSNGNIVVAGYTALDTKSAAQELIAALDTMA